MTLTEHATVNKKHKDSLFRLIFREKKELLSLYNALAGTDYKNPEDLTLSSAGDVIYIHMKNDISFILDDYLNLYEHQSTFNPNMPLRGLLYMAELYKPLVKGPMLYSARKVWIPNPQYIVFYNGTKSMPDKTDLRLSDAFLHAQSGGDIEVTAHMFNINYGQNKELMQKCKKLNEYSYFIATIRKYLAADQTLEDACRLAMDECIRKGILADILERERMLIMNSILTEFDDEAYAKMLHEEGYEDGMLAGREKGKLEATAACILDVLEELGNVADDLRTAINQETNLETLKVWHKLSARADSIEDFRRAAGI